MNLKKLSKELRVPEKQLQQWWDEAYSTAEMLSGNNPKNDYVQKVFIDILESNGYTLRENYINIEREEKEMKEASRRTVTPPYEFGNGISLVSYGMSPNGNHTVTIELRNGQKKSIQTNHPELTTTHRTLVGTWKEILKFDSSSLEVVGKELADWIKKYENYNREEKEMKIKEKFLNRNIKDIRRGEIIYNKTMDAFGIVASFKPDFEITDSGDRNSIISILYLDPDRLGNRAFENSLSNYLVVDSTTPQLLSRIQKDGTLEKLAIRAKNSFIREFNISNYLIESYERVNGKKIATAVEAYLESSEKNPVEMLKEMMFTPQNEEETVEEEMQTSSSMSATLDMARGEDPEFVYDEICKKDEEEDTLEEGSLNGQALFDGLTSFYLNSKTPETANKFIADTLDEVMNELIRVGKFEPDWKNTVLRHLANTLLGKY